MNAPLDSLVAFLTGRVRQVQENLGQRDGEPVEPEDRLGNLLDSMAMVEFLAQVASDCGTTFERLEEAAAFHFGTIRALAAALETMKIRPLSRSKESSSLPRAGSRPSAKAVPPAWLAATAARLPEQIQPASVINEALGRPAGWLENHAGIQQRHLWGEQDPLAAAGDAGRECLERAGLLAEEVGLLLVTSEAPPLLLGLAAAIHQRLDLHPTVPALEVGGACTGFLAALWLARQTLPQTGPALVLAVEAPSRLLVLQPGPAGEAAALFGDGVAAALLCDQRGAGDGISVTDVILGVDGSRGSLIQVERAATGAVELRLAGGPLALQAVRVMARAVREIVQDHGLAVGDLEGVVAHGGNGRLPGMLARELGLPPERVWSETPRAGNLGSASLPVAWAAQPTKPPGPMVWTAVGAGLTWGAMLLGLIPPRREAAGANP